MTHSRKNIMLGTAGHVDHGKTALVKLLTGCNTDRLAEEQKRGLTIELGFAPCCMRDERIVGIVDVPGHVGFIKNMVAGAQGIDVVILVVAADDGVMPQTREHLDILTLMGTRGGLVALTKSDLVDKEMLELAEEDVRQFVAGTFLEGKPICPVSNITGEGFAEFSTALNNEVDQAEPVASDGLFRFWIERVFGKHGFGVVVTGIPSSGEVRVGQKLRLLPSGKTARVRQLEVYGQPSEVGRAGECVAINLSDIESDEIARGQLLCIDSVFEPVEMFEAELSLLPSAPRPLKDYAEVHLHIGTTEAMANVAMLEGKPLQPGETAMVQIRCQTPQCVAIGERFVIRAPGMGGLVTTLGGGRVIGVSNKRLRRKRPWILDMLAARSRAIGLPQDWIECHLKESHVTVNPEAVAHAAQMPVESVKSILHGLVATGHAICDEKDRYIHKQNLDMLGNRILDALADFHSQNPMRFGQSLKVLCEGLQLDQALVDLALQVLIDEGKVETRKTLLALPEHGVVLSPSQQQAYDQVEMALQQAMLQPPRPAELAEKLSCSEAEIVKLLNIMSDVGLVVALDDKVTMHSAAIDFAQKEALELLAAGSFDTMQFRDKLAVSRKYAVPLLDYFDSIKLTHRNGNKRSPGTLAKQLLGP